MPQYILGLVPIPKIFGHEISSVFILIHFLKLNQRMGMALIVIRMDTMNRMVRMVRIDRIDRMVTVDRMAIN